MSDDLHGWAPVRTEDGSWTLRHPRHGETCHTRSGAWLEARERYARPCRLHEREGAVRLLDVGTGLGLNLAAALAEARSARLEIVTLERDGSVLEAALALGARGGGPGEPYHAVVLEALARALAGGGAEGVALGERHTLRLLLGDARETVGEAGGGFDAVFLDPFSPRREPELWEPGFLAALARRMAPGGWLSTYSAASRVRRGLARAGLRVGRGPRVGAKAEGTLASPDEEPPPLGGRARRRLEREREEERSGSR